MYFQKENLAGNHYNWNEESDKQVFTGSPSRRLFDRLNGEQVLFIINLYGLLSDKFTIDKGRMIEQKIMNELPVEIKSEVSVFNWLIASSKPEND